MFRRNSLISSLECDNRVALVASSRYRVTGICKLFPGKNVGSAHRRIL